jgi:hypothetical protein
MVLGGAAKSSPSSGWSRTLASAAESSSLRLPAAITAVARASHSSSSSKSPSSSSSKSPSSSSSSAGSGTGTGTGTGTGAALAVSGLEAIVVRVFSSKEPSAKLPAPRSASGWRRRARNDRYSRAIG